MPPRPPTRSYATILADSPLLSDASRAAALFPTPDDQRRLETLAHALDDSIAANHSAEQTWDALAHVRDTAVKLLTASLGRALL